MQTESQPCTVFNRVNALKVRVPKNKMKNLGQEVRKVYKEFFSDVDPPKMIFNVINKKTQLTSIRYVAVYPQEFSGALDQVILNFVKKHKGFPQKKKKFFNKVKRYN
jgi:hypothetical protein